MNKTFFMMVCLLLVSAFTVSGCQTTNQTITPDVDTEQADEAQLLEQQEPVSESDDVDTLRTELDQTVIVEEDFSDL